MDRFSLPTFIVLDVPAPVSELVRRVRIDNGFYATEPVTISVAGSSGVGVFSADQAPEEAFSILDGLGAKWAPFEAQFSLVHRFPETDIHVLKVVDEAPFRMLHDLVANGQLRFEPSPFPYTPHCTLRTLPLAAGATDVVVPSSLLSGTYELTCLSVYGWELLDDGNVHCPLYHRVRLCGPDSLGEAI